jgi:hypothetical protein
MSYVFANKALDISAFQMNIFKTGIFSERISNLLAYIVLAIEFSSIILLLVNKKLGLDFLLILLLVFTLYISVLFYLGRYEVCGCGGILNGLSYKVHLLINILLILLTFISKNLSNYLKKI